MTGSPLAQKRAEAAVRYRRLFCYQLAMKRFIRE
jgi:hypothetical protein